MRYREDIFIPPHEEFRRAMFCPEVENERRDLAFETARLEEVVARTDHIFSVRPAYGQRGYTFSITLDPFQIGELADGQGKKFADYIARKMIESVVHGAMWGEK